MEYNRQYKKIKTNNSGYIPKWNQSEPQQRYQGRDQEEENIEDYSLELDPLEPLIEELVQLQRALLEEIKTLSSKLTMVTSLCNQGERMHTI